MWRRSHSGAKDSQTLKALLEAESYPGPSLVIAYSHCIAHWLRHGVRHRASEARGRHRLLAALPVRSAARRARRAGAGAGFPAAKSDVARLLSLESRFQLTDRQDHDHYETLVERARHQIAKRVALYHELASHGARGA
jgi:pyruvate-ferredoxin/flavodoxin oxidoreductase